MNAHRWCIGWILLSGMLASTALGQPPPDPEALLDRWLADRQEQIRSLARIELTQDASWTVDGPYGGQLTTWTACLSLTPEEGLTDYVIARMKMNGREVPPEHRRRMAERRLRMLGPALRPHLRGRPRTARLLREVRPISPARLDTTTAEPTWRIEAVPRASRSRADRITLWFDAETERLRRSRLLMRMHPTGPPVIITTRYRTVDRLDVPVHRRIEGAARTQRRLRTFTVLFTYESTFSAYDLVSVDADK